MTQEYLRDTASIEAVLGAVEGQYAGVTGWVRAQCPFCSSSHASFKKNLAYNVDSGYFSCHRCRSAGWTRDRKPKVRRADPSAIDLRLPREFRPIGTSASVTSARYRDYLYRRNVGADAIAQAGVGYCDSGKYANCVIVPVVEGGTIHGFVARSVSAKEYRYPPGMARGLHIFNGDILEDAAHARIVIVEGVFDALPHWPHAAALLGKPSTLHVKRLAACAKHIVVALDADAQSESMALSMKLRLLGASAEWLKLPPAEDPGGQPREEFLRRCKV